MMRANRSTLVKLCLLTALAIPAQRAAATAAGSGAANQPRALTHQLVAQADGTAPEFQLPDSLTDTEVLLIDGSSSMRTMNEALAEQFEARYDTSSVERAASGTDIALARLLDGDIDLAAIGRPLTEAEVAQGLVAVPVAREKIAIFVGPDNPFDGDITFEQFGQIFRGEVTDWAEVGDGSGSGPIRFVDRPETSDTRLAFRPYPVFQAAPFETGATADPVATDETEAVIEAIGSDGIGYAIANQVIGNPAVKIVPMHQTLPDDPRYPFSQPRSYVYVGEPSPAVEGFLAVATSPEGEEAIAEVQATEGAAAAQLAEPAEAVTSPDGNLVARTDENNLAVIEDTSGNLVAGPLAGAGGAVTAMAFSEDGQTLATGTNTGKVRYWNVEDGEPQGESFPAVLGEDNAVTEIRFEGNDKLFVAGSQGRQGLWGLNGLSFGETAPVAGAAGSTAGAATESGGLPWWVLLLPILGLVGVGLWLLGRDRNTGTAEEPRRQTAPTATVPPPMTDPQSDREVSSRAQTVISTDRVVDDSRSVELSEIAPATPPPLPVGEPGISNDTAVASATFESTDLESPDLEGTNLDLLTPGAVAGGAAILGGMAVAAGAQDLSTEADDDDEEWDDNLDLSLDDPDADNVTPEIGQEIRQVDTTMLAASTSAPDIPAADTSTADTSETDLSTPTIAESDATSADSPALADAAPERPEVDTAVASFAIDNDDFWNAVPGGTGTSTEGSPVTEQPVTEQPVTEQPVAEQIVTGQQPDGDAVSADLSSIETIEPTRDTVIAETDTVLDIEPDENTIIGDRAVIFGGAAAAGAAIAAAAISSDTPAVSTEDTPTSSATGDIDSFFDTDSTSSPETDSTDTDTDSPELSNTGVAIVEPDVEADLTAVESPAETDPFFVTAPQISASLEDLEESDNLEGSSSLEDLEGSTELETLGGEIVTDDGNRDVSETDSAESNSVEGSSVEESISPTIPATAIGIAATGLAAGGATTRLSIEELASVDDGLSELPDGYGDSRIVLLPRDPKWAYAYWDVSNEHKEELRQQGGQRLMLRLYDVTDIDQASQAPHSMQQQACHEMARSWYIEIPVSDRDYTAELGYLTSDDRWLMLGRSAPVRVPPIYPSDWVKDQFVTIDFDDSLAGRSFGNLGSPNALAEGDQPSADSPQSYEALFAFTQAQEALRMAGSLYGSMQQMPPGALSESGMGAGLNMSGLNVSGLNMSGIGMGDRRRNFWLVADAELIVYGATEPDATVTIGDRVIPLSADGTFRFHIHFPDGKIDYPIRAVAADGEQSRAITMNFERETPERNTNTKAEAQDEWF